MSPHNPVILIHTSGHGVFVNARALEEIGITAETPDPPGGEIVRDAQGEPTGMLRETAQSSGQGGSGPASDQRPAAEIEADLRRTRERWQRTEAISKGITSFHDMGESFETIDLMVADGRRRQPAAAPLRLRPGAMPGDGGQAGRIPDGRPW